MIDYFLEFPGPGWNLLNRLNSCIPVFIFQLAFTFYHLPFPVIPILRPLSKVTSLRIYPSSVLPLILSGEHAPACHGDPLVCGASKDTLHAPTPTATCRPRLVPPVASSERG